MIVVTTLITLPLSSDHRTLLKSTPVVDFKGPTRVMKSRLLQFELYARKPTNQPLQTMHSFRLVTNAAGGFRKRSSSSLGLRMMMDGTRRGLTVFLFAHTYKEIGHGV